MYNKNALPTPEELIDNIDHQIQHGFIISEDADRANQLFREIGYFSGAVNELLQPTIFNRSYALEMRDFLWKEVCYRLTDLYKEYYHTGVLPKQ